MRVLEECYEAAYSCLSLSPPVETEAGSRVGRSLSGAQSRGQSLNTKTEAFATSDGLLASRRAASQPFSQNDLFSSAEGAIQVPSWVQAKAGCIPRRVLLAFLQGPSDLLYRPLNRLRRGSLSEQDLTMALWGSS
jgi:hypothetical protein